RHYSLMDIETANLIGVYRSQVAALRDVLDTVRRYGRDSREVRSLALAREDTPPEQGLIAAGLELADLALRKCGRAQSATARRMVTR
ncbi:MAG: hypothetical protein HY690_11785, partial [Chloroflexi bacterium]|nr:hypothetical protein [Chloroflexota bacterium]